MHLHLQLYIYNNNLDIFQKRERVKSLYDYRKDSVSFSIYILMDKNFFYSCKLRTLMLIDVVNIIYLILMFSEFLNINFYLNGKIPRYNRIVCQVNRFIFEKNSWPIERSTTKRKWRRKTENYADI